MALGVCKNRPKISWRRWTHSVVIHLLLSTDKIQEYMYSTCEIFFFKLGQCKHWGFMALGLKPIILFVFRYSKDNNSATTELLSFVYLNTSKIQNVIDSSLSTVTPQCLH